jgi:adenine deaminase
MEHQIAEIKGEFGFDVIPTRHYQGNSAHQLISTLAYNLVRNFQIDAGIATARPASAGRTNILTFESLRTLRFEWIAVAGRIVNAAGAKVSSSARVSGANRPSPTSPATVTSRITDPLFVPAIGTPGALAV